VTESMLNEVKAEKLLITAKKYVR